LLHRLTMRPEGPNGRAWSWRRWWREHSTLAAGVGVLVIGLAIAGPWHAMMAMRHGPAFWRGLVAPPQAVSAPEGFLARFIELAPATLPFWLLGAWRALRRVFS